MTTLDRQDQKLLERARLQAMRHRPYFASALLALRPVPLAGLGTVGVDARANLYIDFEVFAAWTEDERAGALVHEVSHLLRQHHDRAQRLGPPFDRRRWNIAADAEINDELCLPLPNGVITPQDLGLEPNQLAETYYLDLEARALDGAGSVDCGGCADGIRRAWESAAGDGLTPAELGAIRRHVAEAVRNSPPGGVARGDRRWAEALKQSRVNWRSALRAAVASAGRRPGSTHWTYRRPSRRRRAGDGVLLPSTYTPEQRIAFVVDTSASMSEDDLSAVAVEAIAILRSFPGAKVRIISCDNDATDEGDLRDGRSLRLTGGGGTDVTAGIDLASAIQPRPSVIVVATDGLTPWPRASTSGPALVALLVGEAAPSPPDWIRAIRVAP